MKKYYSIFLLMVLSWACHKVSLWTDQTVSLEPVMGTEHSNWHLFVNMDSDMRSLVSILLPDVKLPFGIRKIHACGVSLESEFFECYSTFPHFFSVLISSPDHWEKVDTPSFWAVARQDVDLKSSRLPEYSFPGNSSPSILVCMKTETGAWDGRATLSLSGKQGEIHTLFPAPHPLSGAPSLPPGPLTISAGAGSPLMSWFLSGSSPDVCVYINETTAWIKSGRRTVSVGDVGALEQSLESTEPNRSFTLSYSRKEFCAPGGFSLPAEAHHFLQSFDSFEIICENSNFTEECKGRFVLQEN